MEVLGIMLRDWAYDIVSVVRTLPVQGNIDLPFQRTLPQAHDVLSTSLSRTVSIPARVSILATADVKRPDSSTRRGPHNISKGNNSSLYSVEYMGHIVEEHSQEMYRWAVVKRRR